MSVPSWHSDLDPSLTQEQRQSERTNHGPAYRPTHDHKQGYHLSSNQDTEEPMDLDLSSGSPPCRPFSALSMSFQPPEPVIERQMSVISPVSWKTIGNSIGNLMSFKKQAATHIPDLSVAPRPTSPPRPFSPLSTDISKPPDPSVERHTSVSSPVSWKPTDNIIGTLMSLRKQAATCVPEINETSTSRYPGRPFSAPPDSCAITGMQNQRNVTRPPSRLWQKVSSKFPSTYVPQDTMSRQSQKKGYGLPDTDPLFSHYPSSCTEANKNSVRLRKRKRVSDESDEEMNEESGGGPMSSQFVGSTHSKNGRMKKGKMICCCLLILPVVTLLTLHILSLLHFAYCGSMVNFNRTALVRDFETELFGQHIAATVIPDKLQLYFHSFTSRHFLNSKLNLRPSTGADQLLNTCKPITFSFHGSTGVGKTFVSRLISNAFTNVPVKPLIIPLVFPHKSQPWREAETMTRWIGDNLSHCKVNVFIVDEMDKAPDGAVQGLSEAIQRLTSECSPWHPTIFLLLSNTHATKINLMYTQLLSESGISVRDELSAGHFQAIFAEDNQWYDALVEKKQVDAFIPFLPLEKKHAIQCVKRDLKAKGILETSAMIVSILKELHFTRFNNVDFSATGCKRITDKIDFIHSGKDVEADKAIEVL